jgi:hypothetical protein
MVNGEYKYAVNQQVKSLYERPSNECFCKAHNDACYMSGV